MQRDTDGKIVSCSAVGEYMLKKVFHFDKRPIEIIWKAMQVIEMKRELRAKWDVLASSQKDEYVQLDEELESLLEYIFDKKE